MTGQKPLSLEAAVRQLLERGFRAVTAQQVADLLYPDARGKNSKGQVFNLASGITARRLQAARCVVRLSPREWTIIPERLHCD